MPEQTTIKCPCGWTGEFSAGYSGLLVECPQCGKGHRLAMFGAADTTVDMSTLEKLIAPAQPRTLVSFKPLLLLSGVAALLVSAIALPLLWSNWPTNAAVVGGALSWPVAVALAWLGQARQIKRAKRAG